MEFRAVFLSTAEPTDAEGRLWDPHSSICNEYIFNTVVTRAQSLFVAFGNPFKLLHSGSSPNFTKNCWKLYIQRCIQCGTLLFPTGTDLPLLSEVIDNLYTEAGVLSCVDSFLEAEPYDAVVEHYVRDLHSRQEYRVAHKLVQRASGKLSWKEVREGESGGGCDDDEVVLCRLHCQNHRRALAIPNDPKLEPIVIDGFKDRRLGLDGDTVRVIVDEYTGKGSILLDDKTERAMREAHFGAVFVCRVNPENPVQFIPIDKRHPKFVNLPTLTKYETDGVVIFDPLSISGKLQISNFIPQEVAICMLFVVKLVKWTAVHSYPMGIIVAALPNSDNLALAKQIIQISHNIILPTISHVDPIPDDGPLPGTKPLYKGAFTIDPECSMDLDDALTCRLVQECSRGEMVYEIGVHITNVQRYIPKGCNLDRLAQKNGCSAYMNSKIVANMLPESYVQATSLLPHEMRHSYTVRFQAVIDENGNVLYFRNPHISDSCVQSDLKLSYTEAQSIIESNVQSNLASRICRYDSGFSACDKLMLKQKFDILLKCVQFLRQDRLESASVYYEISEPEVELEPQSHVLVEELMIWANREVAKYLMENGPFEAVILRTQGSPSTGDLEEVISKHAPVMFASDILKSEIDAADVCEPISDITMLVSVYRNMHALLKKGSIMKASNLIRFHHLYPQLAVAEMCLHKIRPSSFYQVAFTSSPEVHDYSHESLRCEYYTHFSSPIRRFVDIVVQRLLQAALDSSSRSPYSAEELHSVCSSMVASLKRVQDYQCEVSMFMLASQWEKTGGTLQTAFILAVDMGELSLCFRDLSLKCIPAHLRSVRLKFLNVASVMDPSSPACSTPSYGWLVKMASFNGKADTFLTTSKVQWWYQSPVTENGGYSAEVCLYFLEHGKETNHLSEVKLYAHLQNLTCSIAHESFTSLLQCATSLPGPDEHIVCRKMLHHMQSVIVPNALPTPPHSMLGKTSPLWIFKVNRPLLPYEVLQVQLNASKRNCLLTPQVQLLEIAPALHVCIQHNSDPARCYADALMHCASKPHYESIEDYISSWEPVLLAEAAIASINDTELMILRDVFLQWPQLEQLIDASAGHGYYTLPCTRHGPSGVCMEVPSSFLEYSTHIFRISVGDFVCLRYNLPTKDGGIVRAVFHMVAHWMENEEEQGRVVKKKVFFKFARKQSNYVSTLLTELLMKGPCLCEVQLIPISVPFRYLCKITYAYFLLWFSTYSHAYMYINGYAG